MSDWRRDLTIGDVLTCKGVEVRSQGWGETMVKWGIKEEHFNPSDCSFNPSISVKGLSYALPDITKLRPLNPEPQAAPVVARKRYSPFGLD